MTLLADYDALLAAVLRRPNDDLPRLVLADYLTDHGDAARGEFIRTQCELARLPHDDSARVPLLALEAELLDEHRPRWVVAELRGIQDFHRGFVETIETAAERLVAAASRVFATTPVRGLRLVAVDRFVEDLVRVAGLARIESLDLSNNSLAGGRLVRLLTDAPFTALRGLRLRNIQLWPETLQAIAALPVARSLTRLDLSGNPLSDPGQEDASLVLIAEHPAFGGLTELVARGDGQRFDSCAHAMSAAALAQSTTLTHLRVLDLGGQYVGDAGMVDLVRSPNAAGLEMLDLSSNEIGALGESGYEALVESPYLGRLRRLHLGGNALNRIAAQALAQWPRLANGLTIDLRGCELDAAGRRAIAASPWASQFVLDA